MTVDGSNVPITVDAFQMSDAGRGEAVYARFGPQEGNVPPPNTVSWERAPILLLHGSPGSAGNFNQIAPHLAAAGRQVFAIDLPGFGNSEPWVPSYSILAHAHAALAALDVLGIQRVHLGTWSMGGRTYLALGSCSMS